MTANKAYRMGRIFGEDGRALVLPVDHGIMLGRVPGLEHPRRRLVELAEMGCDGFLMNRGLAAQTEGMFARRGSPARLLTVDTFWREPGEAGSGAGLVASVEDAVRLGMDGVKALMAWNVPSRERQETLSRLARLIAEADRWEVPVVVEPTSLGEGGGPMPVAMEGDAARIAMELGADIIKLSYPGDPEVMAAWCEELAVPLVIMGGELSGGPAEVVEQVGQAVAAGARGVVIGRNLWQRPPEVTRELVAAVYQILHGRPAVALATV